MGLLGRKRGRSPFFGFWCARGVLRAGIVVVAGAKADSTTAVEELCSGAPWLGFGGIRRDDKALS